MEKSGQDTEHLDFKVMVEPKDSQSFTVILVASSRQEKSAWTSDISQVRLRLSMCFRKVSFDFPNDKKIKVLFNSKSLGTFIYFM